jgi:hypothetical protein
MAAGPRYIASARTAQKTPPPRVLPSLHDVIIGTDRTANRFLQLLHCCVLHSRYPAMAISLAPQLLLCGNMPQY